MNYLGASQRGIKNANAHGKSGTDPRIEVLTIKRINFENIRICIPIMIFIIEQYEEIEIEDHCRDSS